MAISNRRTNSSFRSRHLPLATWGRERDVGWLAADDEFEWCRARCAVEAHVVRKEESCDVLEPILGVFLDVGGEHGGKRVAEPLDLPVRRR